MKRRLLALFITTLLFNSFNSSTFGQGEFTISQLQLLDSISTQDVPKYAPGIATAIIQNGKTVYEKCAGFADFADSSLITQDTRFNLASNRKQFTALAVLTLIDEFPNKL